MPAAPGDRGPVRRPFFFESDLYPAVSSYLVQGQETAGFCGFIPVIGREEEEGGKEWRNGRWRASIGTYMRTDEGRC